MQNITHLHIQCDIDACLKVQGHFKAKVASCQDHIKVKLPEPIINSISNDLCVALRVSL